MAAYQNDVDNVDFLVALGGPTLGPGDSIVVNQYASSFTGSIALAVDLVSIVFGPKWTGNISGGVMTFTANRTATGVVEVRWAGATLKLGDTVQANVHNEVICAPVRDGTVSYSTCTITKLRVFRGTFVASTDCIVSALAMTGGRCTLGGAGSPLTTVTVDQHGGVLTVLRNVTTLTAGEDSEVTFDNSAASIANVYFSGKRFTHLQGNIGTKLYLKKGTYDMSGMKRACTFADYEIWEGVKIILPPAKVMADPFTTASKFVGAGPTKVASE